jgi:hypothetical protein
MGRPAGGDDRRPAEPAAEQRPQRPHRSRQLGDEIEHLLPGERTQVERREPSRTGSGSDIVPPASLAATFRRPGREVRPSAKVQVEAGSWNSVRAVDGGPPDIRSGR